MSISGPASAHPWWTVSTAQSPPDPHQDRKAGDNHHPHAVGVAFVPLDPVQLR
jgi:hypothetical protein